MSVWQLETSEVACSTVVVSCIHYSQNSGYNLCWWCPRSVPNKNDTVRDDFLNFFYRIHNNNQC